MKECSTCSICVESKKTMISCNKCEYKCCESCFTIFLKANEGMPLYCFECKNHYTDYDVSVQFTKKFQTFYKNDVKKLVLYDIEKAALPSAQPLANLTLQIKEIYNELKEYETNIVEIFVSLDVLNKNVSGRRKLIKPQTDGNFIIEMTDKYILPKTFKNDLRWVWNMYNDNGIIILDEEIRAEIIKKYKNALFYKKCSSVTEKFFNIVELKNQLSELSSTRRNTETTKWVKKCPLDDCKGFLNQDYKCGLCNKYTCKKCFTRDFSKESEDSENVENIKHVCNQEDVETMKILFTGTKSCVNPTCGMLISKIDGCNHMFCTICKTTFNWVTGKIDLNSTNPHYYQYLRENPNAIVNNGRANIISGEGCADAIDFSDLRTHIIMDDYFMSTIYRITHHIISMELHKFDVQNLSRENVDLRVKFLINEIDIEYYKRIIHSRDKSSRLKREVYDLLTLYINVIKDLFFRFHSEDDLGQYNTKIEIINMINYIDECANGIKKRYNSKISVLTIFNDLILTNKETLLHDNNRDITHTTQLSQLTYQLTL